MGPIQVCNKPAGRLLPPLTPRAAVAFGSVTCIVSGGLVTGSFMGLFRLPPTL